MHWFFAVVFPVLIYVLARDIVEMIDSIKFNGEQIRRAKEELQCRLKTGM